MENENFELDKKEIILGLILIGVLMIAYFIFSYGQYVECVKTVELSIEVYKEIEQSWKLIGIGDEFEECKFPSIP
tara:strand:+ start:97 stop:321 length:225 start_codon:yes stop_codon:yes gene_type:complete